MKSYVRVISEDAKFAKMLILELSDLGIELLSDELLLYGEYKLYIVADLDFCSVEDLHRFAVEGDLIGYSREKDQKVYEKAEICRNTLHRPFLMSEFRSLFVSGDKNTLYFSVPAKKKQYLTVDAATHSAVWGDVNIPVSQNEYNVLDLLCQKRGETVTRNELQALLGAEEGNMSDVYICHLRRKIDHKLGLKLIYTVRGQGYMLKS